MSLPCGASASCGSSSSPDWRPRPRMEERSRLSGTSTEISANEMGVLAQVFLSFKCEHYTDYEDTNMALSMNFLCFEFLEHNIYPSTNLFVCTL